MDRLPLPLHDLLHKAVDIVKKHVSIWEPVLMDFYRRSNRTELFILGGATFLTFYNLASYIRAKREKLRLPPRVGYSLPIVGHFLYLVYDSNRFIDWCTRTYGEVYDLDLFGSRITVTSGRTAEQVLKADASELSLEEGILKDVLHLHYAVDETTLEIGLHANPQVAKAVIPQSRLPEFTPAILQGLQLGLDKMLGDQDRAVVGNPDLFLQRFVAYMSVPSLLGPEVATNPTVIRSFADFTSDITRNIGILMAVPKSLHRFILPYLQSYSYHRKVMAEHVEPVVRARRANSQQQAPNFLQGLLEFQKPDGSRYTNAQVAQAVLLVAFASVHTTSMNLSFCLYWLIARPDLRERLEMEIKQVLGDDGPITDESLQKMVFMDNFIREVLHQGVDKLGTTKAVVCDVYTFANGYQVPKGRRVQTANRQVNFGLNVNRSKVEEMDPSMSGSKLATQPARDFVTFGMGRHLCPGRFFAVHEIKLSLITLLRHYHITTVSGKKPKPFRYLGGAIAVTSKEPLVFVKKN